ncbi:transcription factor/nuclear export subunit protein 2-domain-containing protein [Schizophyllum amplum]|uniref:THO complex subunit 2 n=1 Tax=Schizophyllum amplum TaxID=97359 RepID=A0A550CUH8_9AGAR|nr:transcription factor/nuclear export subunit protein 2-domain-containing protein [Auriculariopsis ampla]
MDIIANVQACLARWNDGGEAQCRALLLAAHAAPAGIKATDTLLTAYNTLLYGLFTTWARARVLAIDEFVALMQAVMAALPSSSAQPTSSAVGAQLVDMIWSLDAELEETLADATKAAQAGDASAVDRVAKDRDTLVLLIQRLLVRVLDAERRRSGLINGGQERDVISKRCCRERLDSPILHRIGLIADTKAFTKKEVRMRTGLFYKQHKFNLLREQSEGFSKLTTEITAALGPSHSPQDGRPTESPEDLQKRVKPIWRKLISLIGYFDLDPNRALDVILDIFAAHLATHSSFFLALLSCSPWAAPDIRRHEPAAFTADMYRGKSLDEILAMWESVDTGASDVHPPRVLAQVLGFKFYHYRSGPVSLQYDSGSEVLQKAGSQTPTSLYLMTALLIREGFITLEDIYPHLTPEDGDDMEKYLREYQEDMQERARAAKNSLLAAAGPLESSGPLQPTPAAPPRPAAKRLPPNQKAGLVNALLAIGAMRPAVYMLSRYNWLVDKYPELADLLIRAVHVAIADLNDSRRQAQLADKDKPKSHKADFKQARPRYGTTGISPAPPRKPMLTLCAPTPPCTHNRDFVFFFPQWQDWVPKCKNTDDIRYVVEPLLRYIGVHLYRDSLLVAKLTRLGYQQLKSLKEAGRSDDTAWEFWFTLLRQSFLPALSMTQGSAVLTVEVWSVVNLYEPDKRWQLYGEWRSSTYQSHGELRLRKIQVDRESKGILRRLSSDTIAALSAPMARLCHTNPTIMFTNAANQIMAYDNLARFFIQALQYSTIMGFDILVWVILDALSNPDKPRVKDDGVNLSDWLQSLASFTGQLFRRFSPDMKPVLRYVVKQLYDNKTSELVVLKELIWRMVAIEPLPTLSDAQVQAMAGGPLLRAEALAPTKQMKKFHETDFSEKASDKPDRVVLRMIEALIDSQLALPLLIEVAQQRQTALEREQLPLKSLSNLFDFIHGVLLQYLDFLTTPKVQTIEQYEKKILPSLRELGCLYGIAPPICWQIMRPVLQAQILKSALEQDEIMSQEKEKALKEKLTAKKETPSRVASPAVDKQVSVSKVNGTSNGPADAPMDVDSSAKPAKPSTTESPWLPQLSVLFDDVKKVAPAACAALGVAFYTTFWQLSSYDLAPPHERYQEEVNGLRNLAHAEDKTYLSKRNGSQAHFYKRRRDNLNTYVMHLTNELKQHTVSRTFTLKRLAREKSKWFAGNGDHKGIPSAFIEQCLLPRCFLSPMDADYCVQMIKVLHTQGTPGFWTMKVYDQLLGEAVRVILFSCTEYEARNYGRFLRGVLTDLLSWHDNEQQYGNENKHKAGDKYFINPGMIKTWKADSSQHISTSEVIDWKTFRLYLTKWHKRICAAICRGLNTQEFMHVYNTILILKEILPVFPVSSVDDTCGNKLSAAIDKAMSEEKRGDLKIIGRAYSAALKAREPFWSKVVQPQTNGTTSAAASPVPEKPRNGALPSSVPPRPPAQPVPAKPGSSMPLPSAPRTQTSTPEARNVPSPAPAGDRQSNLKFNVAGVARPSVVKRTQAQDAAAATTDKSATPSKPPEMQNKLPEKPRELEPPKEAARPIPVSMTEPPRSPRSHRINNDRSPRPPMPPPVAPSQTPSAQELRETAKQSIGRNETRPPSEPRSQTTPASSSPRVRSPSPASRPGTRNHSAESRGSGGRSRTEDDKRESKHRDGPAPAPARRDSVTHVRSERREKDGERERERGRDRHGDRDRERDRDHRDRDHRDRDRHRKDEHRKDDKERDRDRDRKERDSSRAGSSRQDERAARPDDRSARPDDRSGRPDDRAGRPDERVSAPAQLTGSRIADEALGKRRRSEEDVSLPDSKKPRASERNQAERERERGQNERNERERGATERERGATERERGSNDRDRRRSSRRETTHRDDRVRRAPDHDGRPREPSDRRRRDQREDGAAAADRAATEKRIPDGPASNAAPKAPPTAPSAPRADRHREQAAGREQGVGNRDQNGGNQNGGSRDTATGNRDQGTAGTPPAAPSSAPSQPPGGTLLSRLDKAPPPLEGYARREEDRKRTFAEREEPADAPNTPTEQQNKSKRIRLDRTRYGPSGPNVINEYLSDGPGGRNNGPRGGRGGRRGKD